MILQETIKILRDFGTVSHEIPKDVLNNLTAKVSIRDYQIEALSNYITYYEALLPKGNCPRSFLFNMATGSGKTYIMASCILYLYTKGYQNFVFFVNSTNIVAKTKDNFLNSSSNKYLFNDSILIDGKAIKIHETDNFQFPQNSNDINIVFTTTQALHIDLTTPKENAITWDDFQRNKICFISDESHHLYASTKKQKALKSCRKKTDCAEVKGINDSSRSWENTVNNLLNACSDNLMLEFTATCDLEDENVRQAAEPKLGYVYSLTDFYNDLFCKKIEAIEVNIEDRILLGLMINQYKQIIFANHQLNIKPVILFKTDNAECVEFEDTYLPLLKKIAGSDIRKIFNKYSGSFNVLSDLASYLTSQNISDDQYADILKEHFSEKYCLVTSTARYQSAIPHLNSLENKDNLYRVVFECQRLDEGWDVLNLFDIVRLYDTANARDTKTILEAQLIGRGARYCPFITASSTEKFKRKFDNEPNNKLGYCETLYYFCTPESLYIRTLQESLKDIGLTIKTNAGHSESNIESRIELKESFKESQFYKTGIIFTNRQKTVSFGKGIDTNSLPPQYFAYYSSPARKSELMSDKFIEQEEPSDYIIHSITFSEISSLYHFNVLRFYFCKYGMNFRELQKLFSPHLHSVKEFLTSEQWLGKQRMEIKLPTSYEKIPLLIINKALNEKMPCIIDNIKNIAHKKSKGTKVFDVQIKLADTIKDYIINAVPIPGSIGYSQNDYSCKTYQRNLKHDVWHVYKDNLGSSEEKKLVHEIAADANWQKILQNYGNEIYLIRNEEKIPVFAFEDGRKFFPDYILVAGKIDET